MQPWQLTEPASAIIFDCDGTLSKIEGVDELARVNEVGEIVCQLTAEAMSTTGINPRLYEKRLDLICPTEQQVTALGQTYYRHLTPDADHVIQLFHRLNKPVYVLSAGLKPAVSLFCELLSIPNTNVFAVDIFFAKDGQYSNFDHTSPLIQHDGKREIVKQLLKIHDRVIYVGDGMNDYAVYDLATRFVGYGGAYYRKNIESLCEYYIKTESLAPLIPLSLTEEETKTLTPNEVQLYSKGYEGLKHSKKRIS